MKSLQLDKPHAIVVIGIQGSGKTFFASKFADTFNAPFIEQVAFENAARDHQAADGLMQVMIREILKTGRTFIIETSLSTRTERTEMARNLKQAGYIPMFVWVQVDAETALQRAYRTTGVDEATYRERMKRFSPPHATERSLVISGKHTFATQAKAVLRKLSSPRPLPSAPNRSQPQRGQIIVR